MQISCYQSLYTVTQASPDVLLVHGWSKAFFCGKFDIQKVVYHAKIFYCEFYDIPAVSLDKQKHIYQTELTGYVISEIVFPNGAINDACLF